MLTDDTGISHDVCRDPSRIVEADPGDSNHGGGSNGVRVQELDYYSLLSDHILGQ